MEKNLTHNAKELENAYAQLRIALDQRREILAHLDASMHRMDRNFRKYHNSLTRLKLDITKVENAQETLIKTLS